MRVEIEALLSMGLPNSPMAGSDIRVASGNFVTAKPIGIVDGVDLVHTGEVRKIDVIGIRDRLDHNELVLLSPLGYSPTGEIFNLALEDVAMSAAVALSAEKLIFLMDTPGVVTGKRAELKHELTCSQAEKLLARAGALAGDVTLYLPRAVSACRAGVKRAHLISRHADGALLLELFTHRGVGTMVTQDPLEKLRPARIEDIGGILRLLEPLEADGTLVKRGRDLLEMEIDRFFVLEHDRVIIGCAALYQYDDGMAELAALAVHPDHRRAGAGRAPAAGDRAARETAQSQAALRADDAHRALVHRARFQCGAGVGAAAAQAGSLQFPTPLEGAGQAPVVRDRRQSAPGTGVVRHS